MPYTRANTLATVPDNKVAVCMTSSCTVAYGQQQLLTNRQIDLIASNIVAGNCCQQQCCSVYGQLQIYLTRKKQMSAQVMEF